MRECPAPFIEKIQSSVNSSDQQYTVIIFFYPLATASIEAAGVFSIGYPGMDEPPCLQIEFLKPGFRAHPAMLLFIDKNIIDERSSFQRVPRAGAIRKEPAQFLVPAGNFPVMQPEPYISFIILFHTPDGEAFHLRGMQGPCRASGDIIDQQVTMLTPYPDGFIIGLHKAPDKILFGRAPEKDISLKPQTAVIDGHTAAPGADEHITARCLYKA